MGLKLQLYFLAFIQVFSLLIVDYRFNQNFGQVFYDYSGLGNHGQNGESYLTTQSDTVPTDRGAYFSNSQVDYIMIPPNLYVSSSFTLGSTYSIAMWCMCFDTKNIILTQRISDEGHFLNVERKKSTNSYRVRLNKPGFLSGVRVGSEIIVKGDNYVENWAFLSIINEGTFIKFYVNGVISLSIDQMDNYSESGVYSHYIGYTTDSFEGFMWNYKIFDESITNGEFYSNSYSGGNCILSTCQSSCAPALKQDEVSYCMPYNILQTSDSQMNSCDSGCSSAYGCNINFCLDCSNCLSHSCEISGSSLICLNIQNIQCLTNQYYNNVYLTCENCYNECFNCTNSQKCLTCIDPHSEPHPYIGCICIDGYYNLTALVANQSCQKCHLDCKKCETAQLCTECLDSYALPSNLGCECINGYYKSSLGCNECYSDCSSCNNSITCDTCKAQNSIPNNIIGCICDEGYYNITHLNSSESCIKCYKDCLNCDSNFKCLNCITNNAIPNSIQGCVCKDGYFNLTELTDIAACIQCGNDCLTCNEYTTCTKCKDPIGIISLTGCICPDFYYKLPSGYCESCNLDCLTCESTTTCISCLDQNARPSILGCECIQGFYNFSSSYQLSCKKCPDTCLECTDYNNCSKCKNNFMNIISGICKCPENSNRIDDVCVCDKGYDMMEINQGFYYCQLAFNFPNNNNCSENCFLCENYTYCTLCIDKNFILFNGTCFGSCSKNYFFNAGKCELCPKLCKECNASCTICEKNAYLSQNICICEKGFKEDNGKCIDAYFYANLSISTTNNILITFNEPTEVNLDEDNFLFWVEKDPVKNSEVFKINLLKIKNNLEYLFSLYSKSDIKGSWLLDVKIDKKNLFSKTESKLFNYTLCGQLSVVKSESSLYSQLLNSTKAATKITVSSSLGSAIVSSPGPAWSLLNTIQIISYLPLSSNPLTSVLINFFTAFSSYNIVPNIADYIFEKNATSEPYLESRRYGIDTSVFFINLGSNSLIFFFVIVTWPVLALFARYSKGKLSQKALKLLKNYKFNFFIRFWLQAYLDIGIFSLIQLRAKVVMPFQGNLNQLLAGICMVIIIKALVLLTPHFLIVFSYISKSQIFSKSPQFLMKYGSLYDEFKLNKGFLSCQFYLFHSIRRLTYIFSQVYLNNAPYLQGASNIFFSLMMLIYVFWFLPFKEKNTMASVMIGETSTTVAIVLTYVYLFDVSIEVKKTLELVLIFTIITCIAIQLLISFYSFFKEILMLWSKFEKARAMEFVDNAKRTIPELSDDPAKEVDQKDEILK